MLKKKFRTCRGPKLTAKSQKCINNDFRTLRKAVSQPGLRNKYNERAARGTQQGGQGTGFPDLRIFKSQESLRSPRNPREPKEQKSRRDAISKGMIRKELQNLASLNKTKAKRSKSRKQLLQQLLIHTNKKTPRTLQIVVYLWLKVNIAKSIK